MPRGHLLAPALAALAAACTGPSEPPPPRPTPPTAAPPPPPPAPPPPPPAPLPEAPPPPDAPSGATGTLALIRNRADVRLTGYRVEAKPGDWLLESAGNVAVVSVEGKLIDYGPQGSRDELIHID